MTKPVKIFAFDIETVGLGGEPVFWSWCDVDGFGGEPVKGSLEFTDCFISRALSSKNSGAVIVAHNGLRFDFLRLDWERILESGFSVRCWTGKDTIRGLDFKRGKSLWRLRDSVTWSPSSLSDFVSTFSRSRERKGKAPDWENETFDCNDPLHVEYAVQDSRILYDACVGFNYFLMEKFGVDIRGAVTLSGFAVKSLKKLVGQLPDFPVCTDSLGRETYHGGLTCAFQVGAFRDITYLDINSSYASVMIDNPLPCGIPFRVCANEQIKSPHLVHATISIPDTSFPFLLSRNERGKFDRVTGIVVGIWWNFEIDIQVGLGASVIKIHDRFVFPSYFDGVSKFVQRLAKLRMSDYDGPVGKLAKLMQNGLAGKFGVVPRSEQVVLSIDPPCPEALPFIDSDRGSIPFFWRIPDNRMPSTRVFWGSFINAKARCNLIDYMSIIPRDEWIYTDTDSLTIPRKYVGRYKHLIGPKYGQLKIEAELSEMKILGRKVYVGKLANGKLKFKAKGIPRRLAERAFSVKANDRFVVRGTVIESKNDGEIWYEQSVGLNLIMNGKMKLKDNNGQYTKIAKRRLSGPGSTISGKYKNGRWVPKKSDGSGLDVAKIWPWNSRLRN